MKTNTKLYLLAVSAAALSLGVPKAYAQPFDSVEALNNRAIAASPRAKEVFPWLTRSTAKAATPARSSASKTALTEVTRNRALATSPRMLEQFPELARPAQPVKSADRWVASTVIKNRALASSPRAREEFPWLARGDFTVREKPFEIAPLK